MMASWQSFHIVLRNRAVVPDDLLSEVIGGVMLLEQRAAFVLFVRQDRLDGAFAPHIPAFGRLDAHRGQLLGNGLEGETLEELTIDDSPIFSMPSASSSQCSS